MDRLSPSNLLHRLRQSSPFRRHKTNVPATTTPSSLASPDSPPHFLDGLIQKVNAYLSDDDVALVIKAFHFADKAHLGQMRDSGLPYITHPVAVCEICAEWKLDVNALMAALLHDTIEDQDVTKQEIAETFNADVAELVDGLTKLDKLHFNSKAEQQAESFRKMLLAMAKDIRVILVKLADRLHNMSTLDGVTPEKARRVARETLEIYAPIADRLGLYSLVRRLHNMCMQAAHPYRYQVLQKALQNAKGNRREVLSKIFSNVKSALPAQGIEAEVIGREKSIYSIHKKMIEQKKSFSDVLDILGFRVIVNTLPECYLTLGVLHQLYRPVPGKFKDYIAIPKINGYQSLHTTLAGPFGSPIEFQIRTREMDNMAEKGLVSHWIYKSKGADLNEIQQQTHRWLQSLLDIQSQTRDSSEFLELVKIDLFPDAVFVLTPRGKVITLPRGSTPVDFAYAIHTDIGNHIHSCLINNQPASISTPLHSGNTVEIITSPDAHPENDWLDFVRSGRARSEIRNYLKKVDADSSTVFGAKLLQQAMHDLKIEIPPSNDPSWDKLVKSAGASSLDEILLDIGLGNRLAAVVARRFLIENPMVKTTAKLFAEAQATPTTIFIQGKEGNAVQLATCCSPIPGDQLIGFTRPGHGIIVHTQDCSVAIKNKEKEPIRCVHVAWDSNPSKHLTTRVEILADNEKGMLGSLFVLIAQSDSNVVNVTTKEDLQNIMRIQLTLQVEDRNHLARIIRKVRGLKAIYKITRIKG